MKKVIRNQTGFTLLEIIVVLAVLGALAAMLTPVVFRYLDDANRTRANGDARAIAASIQQMYKDTGRWPFYADGDAKLTYTAGTDAAVLSTNATCATGACTDATLPEDSTTGATWALATAKIDHMANHLIANTPYGVTTATLKYATTGSRAWKGPYLDRIPALDAWGRSYVVNIGNADPDAEGATQKWVVVVSAGPDGNLDTLANATGVSNPQPGGDDIVARAK